MKSLYIKDLQKNQVFTNEVFLIYECEKREGKNGKTYCSLVIGDKTGKLQAKIWDDRLSLMDQNLLKKETLVSVSGKVDEFMGNLQVTIYEMVKVEDSDLQDFLETSEYDPDEMMNNILEIIENIQTPSIKKILSEIINDQEINQRLKFWPAAASVHHDFRSGLMQHILEMYEISQSLKRFYPNINYDILTAGIILHDIGKVYELDSSTISVEYSKEGMLIGHIVKGVLLFESFGARSLPEDIYLHITHLILSHHGKKEYGSPILPSTVEAIMLTYIDNLSAKSRTAMKARNNVVEGEDFGSYNNFLDGVKLWRGGDLISSAEEDLPADLADKAAAKENESAETDQDISEGSDEDLGQLTF